VSSHCATLQGSDRDLEEVNVEVDNLGAKGIRMLTDYIRAAMRQARYKILPDDGTYFGEIPGVTGVWANADNLEECRDELEEVLEEWIALSLSRRLPIPSVGGVDLVVPQAS